MERLGDTEKLTLHVAYSSGQVCRKSMLIKDKSCDQEKHLQHLCRPFVRPAGATAAAAEFQRVGGLNKDIRAFHECLLSFHRGERGMWGGDEERGVRWEEL